ncbi:heat-inducible transcriptional repressor HrcA [Secundilactobacillus collinoides]|uniref:Heat-inducible transcription repressor HrcA n=2 Tax=Secundilactobacillus collinoides TaxID=33960 RepID=A0A0R2BBG3_SECCO|nr:heat-inducible transcriptional repressor HrcA [Secundilactobacillus collinoides]KRM76568.1 heat-inducible transcription repressor [Secundilactobacillus collinoides DSM 20515 = JCM 1123]KZL42637.1 HrcA family transcriptional regulator [Secundilactobacillus collinoides]
MITLTDRQKMILKAIVRDYTSSGVPVGSKALAAQLPMHVSSATVRNEMAALEELGLINKTHSSSGRIPSVKGYRYYVDHLVQPDPVKANDIDIIKSSLDGQFLKIDEIIETSAQILSNLTSYTAFTLKPELQDSKLSGFRLVPLGKRQVMAVLVTDNGDAETQTFNLAPGVTGEQLEAVVRLINDQLVGKSLREVLQELQTKIPQEVTKYLQSPEGFLKIFGDVLTQAAQERYYVGGRLNLLNFSDSSDVDELKSLYTLMDRTDDMADVLGRPSDHIQVKIGSEMTNAILRDYSLITATYEVGDHGKGVIALLGPTRMPYSRMIGLVGTFRQELAKRLTDYYRYFDQ